MTIATFETLPTNTPTARLDKTRVQELANHAENIIRAHVPMLENLCDADADFAARVVEVETDMVMRVLTRGEDMFMTDAEKDQLRQNVYARPSVSLYQPVEDNFIINVGSAAAVNTVN